MIRGTAAEFFNKNKVVWRLINSKLQVQSFCMSTFYDNIGDIANSVWGKPRRTKFESFDITMLGQPVQAFYIDYWTTWNH